MSIGIGIGLYRLISDKTPGIGIGKKRFRFLSIGIGIRKKRFFSLYRYRYRYDHISSYRYRYRYDHIGRTLVEGERGLGGTLGCHQKTKMFRNNFFTPNTFMIMSQNTPEKNSMSYLSPIYQNWVPLFRHENTKEMGCKTILFLFQP